MASSPLHILFIGVFVVGGTIAALPGGLKGCKQSSGDYKNCLATQVETAFRYFKDGDKKLGIEPIDPFRFDKLLVDQGNGPVAIKLEFTNLDLNGLSEVKIADIKNDWKTLWMKLKAKVLNIVGDYTITGKVLVLPISGTGKSNITFFDMDVDITMKLKELSKNSKSYFQVEDIKTMLNTKKTYIHFDNLFNGDKALGDNMNLFLNENNEEIINELKPAISKGLSEGFGRVTNKIFSKILLNEIKLK